MRSFLIACSVVLSSVACTPKSYSSVDRKSATLPLTLVADVELPGKPVRFDYQAIHVARGNLVVAHMNDDSVVIVKLGDGSLVKVVPHLPTARGVAIANEVDRIFVTCSPNHLVILDSGSFATRATVETGSGPDGVAWDAKHHIVAVSDQGDGAVSLIDHSGSGARRQVSLGKETGNVVFDPTRGVFWITVVSSSLTDLLVAIEPQSAKKTTEIALPGCVGAHGLSLRPDGKRADIACEASSNVVSVALADPAHALVSAPTGRDPDVMAVDPGLGWLYVAAESGELTVFDVTKPGLVRIGSEHPGAGSHSVAVDPATHHVFFPLAKGANGKPILRIMKPSGT